MDGAVDKRRESGSDPVDRAVDAPAAALLETDAMLVCQPIAAGHVEPVRDLVADAREESGTGWLLDGEDVVTVSLFVRPSTEAPCLVWYVEVHGPEWEDPAAELWRRSPLFDAGLGDHLAAASAPLGDTVRQAIHARNPARPGQPDDPDVVLVTVGVEPGVGTALARLLTWLFDRLEGTWVQARMVESTAEVLDDERMWTETLWLARGRDGATVYWYMEADDMAGVLDAYEASDNPVARWSERLLDHLFVDPMSLLDDPLAATEFDLLAHATAPERR